MKFRGPGGDVEVELLPTGAHIDGREVRFHVTRSPDGAFLLSFADGRVVRGWAALDQVHVEGRVWRVPEAQSRRSRSAGPDEGSLLAPMPGVVLQVRVAVGDEVEEGAILMVVEAMKMEQPVRAPRPGRVSAVCFAEGERVGPGDKLVELEGR